MPRPAAWDPDMTWIRSDKLDADAQEMVVRALDDDLVFPFEIAGELDEPARGRIARGGVQLDEPSSAAVVVRARPAQLRAVVQEPLVRSVRCAARAFDAPADEAWREKVDVNVRTIVGAGSTCWASVTLRFSTAASEIERRELEQLGVIVFAFDAKTALIWAPVRGIPHLAALAFVERIEDRS